MTVKWLYKNGGEEKKRIDPLISEDYYLVDAAAKKYFVVEDEFRKRGRRCGDQEMYTVGHQHIAGLGAAALLFVHNPSVHRPRHPIMPPESSRWREPHVDSSAVRVGANHGQRFVLTQPVQTGTTTDARRLVVIQQTRNDGNIARFNVPVQSEVIALTREFRRKTSSVRNRAVP